MLNATIETIDVRHRGLRTPIPANFSKQFEGRKVLQLRRRAKYILAFASGGSGFVLHLGMSGRIKIYAEDRPHEPEKHDHVCFIMKGGARIVFNDPRRFGMLFAVRSKDWAAQAPFDSMGPEPLENEFSGSVLHTKLKKKQTPIKSSLLDQRVVAGVGNIYACEALWRARIHPLRPSASLTGAECRRLAAAIRQVLLQAIEAGGSSLRDYRHPDDGLGYFQHQFGVYDRAGRPCGSCDCNVLKTGGVRRIVQAGRSTFYCLQKQAQEPARKKKS